MHACWVSVSVDKWTASSPSSLYGSHPFCAYIPRICASLSSDLSCLLISFPFPVCNDLIQSHVIHRLSQINLTPPVIHHLPNLFTQKCKVPMLWWTSSFPHPHVNILFSASVILNFVVSTCLGKRSYSASLLGSCHNETPYRSILSTKGKTSFS